MTQTAEDIAIKVTLDGTQARQELDTLGKSSVNAATAAGNLNKNTQALQQGLSKTAGVVNSLSGAFGDGSSAAGKFLSAGSQLAGAFVTGGLIGAGLAAGVYAVSAIAGAMAEARAQGKIFGDSVNAMHVAVRTATEQSLEPMRKTLADLTKELENYGKTSRQVTVDDAVMAAENLRIRRATLERNVDFMRDKLQWLAEEQTRLRQQGDRAAYVEAVKQGIVEQAAVIAVEKRLETTSRALAEADSAATQIEAKVRQLDALDAKKKAKDESEKGAKKDAAARVDPLLADFDEGNATLTATRALQAALDARQKIRDDADQMERAVRGAQEKDALDALRALEKEKAEIAKQAATKKAADAKAALDAEVQMIKEVTALASSIGVGATMGLMDAMITGQEKALEHFAVSVMRQAGSAMIASGIQSVAAAAAYAWNPVTAALAPAGFATGAALIAGGMALGGIGTGLEHTMINGGKIGQKAPDKSGDLDRGANGPRKGGGGGASGGQIVFVNNYGVYGPSSESSAREQTRMTRTARRRGLT